MLCEQLIPRSLNLHTLPHEAAPTPLRFRGGLISKRIDRILGHGGLKQILAPLPTP